MIRPSRLVTLLSLLAVSTALPAAALAWEPEKPIDYIIMSGKGGGADKMARLFQGIVADQNLSAMPLVPANLDGGSGAEALIKVSQAKDPDHTLMVTLNSFFTTPLMQPKLGVDVTTFAPVGRMAEDTFVLWVHKDEGIATFEEFVEKAKAEGAGWVMGGTGRSQEDELLTNYLNEAFGLSIKYIPYKGGGEVAKELAGKQIRSSVNNPSEAQGFYESGDLIPLVAFTDERLEIYPDVPTLKEKGQDFSYYMQRAVVGAPGMSQEALDYYEALFRKVFDSPEWQEYRSKQALTGDWIEGEALTEYWKEQVDRHRTMLTDSGALKN